MMVRYFLTDLRGNPIYSFAQRLHRNTLNRNNHTSRLSLQLQQQQQQQWSAVQLPFRDHDLGVHGAQPRLGRRHEALRVTPGRSTRDGCRHGEHCFARGLPLESSPDVIRALATPVTARHANHEGATPLHIAASHRCSATASSRRLQALFNACRAASNDAVDRANDDKHTSPSADFLRWRL